VPFARHRHGTPLRKSVLRNCEKVRTSFAVVSRIGKARDAAVKGSLSSREDDWRLWRGSCAPTQSDLGAS
jgi:hypothetical protein